MIAHRRDYFASRYDRVAALKTALESWRGTPFRQRSLVKGAGGGVDCAGFLGFAFWECGAIPHAISVPPYDVNHAEHSEQSLIRDWFERADVRQRVRRVDEDEAHVDGDIVFPIVGRAEHHVAARIGQLVYHVSRKTGFCMMSIAQMQLARSRYRLLEIT